MKIDYRLLGKRIRDARTQENMSQMQLADAAGFSLSYISYIESGRKHASLQSVVSIADTLGRTVDELMSGNQYNNPTDYLPDIDLLLSDCSARERRFLFEIMSASKSILRANGWKM